MEWEELKSDIENIIGKRLDQLQSNLDIQKDKLLVTKSKVQLFAELVEKKMQNLTQTATLNKNKDSIPESPFPRSKTAKVIPKQDLSKTAPIEIKSIKKDESKKSQIEEAKIKKLEEAKKKKEEEEAKRKEAQLKKKEEEEKKKELQAKQKEEAKKKADEIKEKKKQEEIEKKLKQEEAKKKLEEEKERKRQEEIEKKIKSEESKKKAEEAKEKKKQEEIEKKAKAEKDRKKKEENEKNTKIEEEKKKTENAKKKKETRPPLKPEQKKPSSSLSSIKPDDGSTYTDPSSELKPFLEESLKQGVPETDPKIQESLKEQPFIEEIIKEPESGQEISRKPSKENLKPEETKTEGVKTEEMKPSLPSEPKFSIFPSLDEVKILLNYLKSAFSEEEINTEKKFELSVGAKSALCLLTTLDEDKFYLDRVPREEVIWTFRIFFIFLDQDLPEENEEAWKECQNFWVKARNKEKNYKTVDKFIIDTINQFSFSDENIDKIEKIVCGKEALLQPQYYTEFCALTGLLMFGVREAVLFGGAIQGKVPVYRQYKRLLHKQQQFENMVS